VHPRRVVRRRVTRARVPVSIASRHRRPTTTSPATTRSMDGHRGPIAREGGDYATGHDRLRPIPETDHTPRARANVRAGPSVRVYYIPVRTLVVRTTTSYLVVSTWYHDRSVGRSRRSVGRSRRRRHTRARVDGPTDRPRRSRRSRTPRALDDDDDVSSSTFATDGRSRPGVDRRGRRTRGPTRGVHGASRGGGAEGHVRESEIVARATIAGGFGESSRRRGGRVVWRWRVFSNLAREARVRRARGERGRDRRRD